MKFGKSIGSQQDGNLEVHYVDYKVLKKRIKDVVEQLEAYKSDQALQANSLFEKELESEIELVNACFAKRQSELLQKAASLSEDLHQRQSHCFSAGQSSSSCVAACPSLTTREQRPYSFRQLVEILGAVDQLRKYAVWNAVAVVKILKKRRKQTNFGLEDTAAERAAWLSRQSFFSGSDFAELHATIESLGQLLVISELQLEGGGTTHNPQLLPVPETEQCPICLETISDMVELPCNHRFCWKCFVLGPIAFQPGEYRITQCPLCRTDACNPIDGQGDIGAGVIGVPRAEGLLTRFLHTYFPKEGGTSADKEEYADPEARNAGDEREMREAVDMLVKALLVDSTKQSPSEDARDGSSQQLARCKETTGAVSSDFFQTLPSQPTEKNLIGAAQKLQWLQLASTGDSFALDGTMYCSLCSDPLLMEVVVTTPCKHHFHQICIGRLEEPRCPLCNSQLPFDWFLPTDHPCAQSGFHVVPIHKYKPLFPGGPSKGTGGFPLHQPPPVSLLGPSGITMKSYLHKMLPVKVEDDVGGACAAESPSAPASPELGPHPAEDQAEISASDSSSSDSCSEDGAYGHDEHDHAQKSKPHVWACSAVGKIRLLERHDESQVT